jgi:septal ring factor EnvC (AmiA/AmiB activator)
MKKFSLIMVFIILMTLIVSFNYLLWDRDSKMKEMANLESINAGKNISINAQNSEIRRLENEKAELLKKLSDIQKENNELQADKKALNYEVDTLKDEIQIKNALVCMLAEKEDLGRLAKPVANWIKAINDGDYEKAWDIEFGAKLSDNREMYLETYTNAMKQGVKSIKLVSAELDKQSVKDKGLIYLKVKLEVSLAEGIKSPHYGYFEGINERTVRIDYSMEQEEYIIADIRDAL